MTSYRVWARSTRVDGSDRCLCVVVAIPDLPGENVRAESESRLLAPALADEGCAEMARAMAKRIRERGDAVLSIQVS